MAVGGLHPQQIRVIAFVQAATLAGVRPTATEQPLQETLRRKAPSNPIRTTEQVGRSESILVQGSLKELLCQWLPLQIRKQVLHQIHPCAALASTCARMACCT